LSVWSSLELYNHTIFYVNYNNLERTEASFYALRP